MTLLTTLYLFIFGLVLGSFYNVAGLRVPMRQSVVSPPSQCPHCGQRLKARDLIPVVSWAIAKAKCRNCAAPIPLLYPLGELGTGLMFVWVFITYGYTWETVIGLLLVSLTHIITVSDLKYMLIPNRILLVFAPIFVAVRLCLPLESVWHHLWGALFGGGILLLVAVVSRGGMGMGDVKLFALLGWIVGFPNAIVALMVALLTGTLVGGALLLTGTVTRKQPIPFGPFLLFGSLLAYAYGSSWIPLYLSLFK